MAAIRHEQSGREHKVQTYPTSKELVPFMAAASEETQGQIHSQ
jgi:hypothetical protein